MAKAGIAADGNGDIFAMTGNGTFDASSGGSDYGDSFLKLSTSGGGLAVADYFTPFNQSSLNSNDHDVGSGGPLLLPTQPGAHPDLVIGGSKDGTIYVVDRDQMGHFQPTSNSQIVQTIVGAVAPIFGAPAYWNGNVDFVGDGDYAKAFAATVCFRQRQPPCRRPRTAIPVPRPAFPLPGIRMVSCGHWSAPFTPYCTPTMPRISTPSFTTASNCQAVSAVD